MEIEIRGLFAEDRAFGVFLRGPVARRRDGVGGSSQSGGGEEFAGGVPGARLVIYETGARKSAVGTAVVVSVDATDAKRPVVKIKAGRKIAAAVSLEQIKAEKIFRDSPLVRQGRLSVVALSGEQYKVLTGE